MNVRSGEAAPQRQGWTVKVWFGPGAAVSALSLFVGNSFIDGALKNDRYRFDKFLKHLNF